MRLELRFQYCILLALSFVSLLSSCKKKSAKLQSTVADAPTANLSNLQSADGRLRSFGDIAEMTACDESREGYFSFIANTRAFYRCKDKTNVLLADTSAVKGCRALKISADIAATGGAEHQYDSTFLGVNCEDGEGYLINEATGLVPKLIEASYDESSKTVTLRATRVTARTGSDAALVFSRGIKFAKPLTVKVSAMPLKLQVLPGGDASHGQFLYIRMNEGAFYCSYRSSDREIYGFAACRSGATPTNAEGDSGLIGGDLIDGVSGAIPDVSSMEMIFASTAIHAITTVDFSVTHN